LAKALASVNEHSADLMFHYSKMLAYLDFSNEAMAI